MELVKTISNSKLTKSLLLIILGSILLTISAKIQIPFYPVPMTMQTFVVIFIGIAFGWKLGLATVATYLFEGAIGLPVFAGTPEKGIFIFAEMVNKIEPKIEIKKILISLLFDIVFTSSIYCILHF